MSIFRNVTLRNLKKNKTRTIVTIIGIILSVAMFTAVTTCVASLQGYLSSVVEQTDGKWYAAAYSLSKNKADEIAASDDVPSSVITQNIGWSEIDNEKSDKPYIFIEGVNPDFTELLNVTITEGRMPEKTGEILLPVHLKTLGYQNYAVGDKITLNVGVRTLNGEKLTAITEYDGSDEALMDVRPMDFTVVGIYERPAFEENAAGIFTALSVTDNSLNTDYNIFFTTSSMRGVYSFICDNLNAQTVRLNNDLLRYNGVSDNGKFNLMIYSLAGILMLIIMFGSISLIYNAFSISVSERTKQFGLMKSIGASDKQLRSGVIYEAFVLSLAGVPLGILSGLLGIGVTLYFTKDLFAHILNNITCNAELTMIVNPWAIVTAAAAGLITVLISAYIPAARASKVSAIDAIRQTNDIAVTRKSVKTSRLNYKLFGFEGMLAAKNFKRSRKKYRATVISLFMSVVLFISASSLCTYLTSTVDAMGTEAGYDVSYSLIGESKEICPTEEFAKVMAGTSAVTSMNYSMCNYDKFQIDSAVFTKDFADYHEKTVAADRAEALSNGATEDMFNDRNFNCIIMFLDDSSFREYLTENGIAAEKYFDSENPVGIACGFSRTYDNSEGKYVTFANIFAGKSATLTSRYLPETLEGGYVFSDTRGMDDTGADYYCIYKNEQGETKELLKSEAMKDYSVSFDGVLDKMPKGTAASTSGIPAIIFPYSFCEMFAGAVESEKETFFCASSAYPGTTYSELYEFLTDKDMNTARLTNAAEQIQSGRALSVIMNIFSYGFITLISLIAVANVFNTVSTNILLRRREFAMLKSVGLTKKGFNRMMNYESLLYGLKGLLYGIPVSVIISYLIYRSIGFEVEMDYIFPWQSVCIAIVSVFLVVFATIAYSKNKIKNDNTIDTLKNENI